MIYIQTEAVLRGVRGRALASTPQGGCRGHIVLSIRALSVLSPYCLRTHLRTVDFAGFRIRTVYVLSPDYIRTL